LITPVSGAAKVNGLAPRSLSPERQQEDQKDRGDDQRRAHLREGLDSGTEQVEEDPNRLRMMSVLGLVKNGGRYVAGTM